jgi:alpha-galactosidase
MMRRELGIDVDRGLGLNLICDGTLVATAHLEVRRASVNLLSATPSEVVTLGPTNAELELRLDGDQLLRVKVTVAEIGHPGARRIDWTVTNAGSDPITLDGLVAPQLILAASAFPAKQPIWTMQGAATQWGQDFAFPLAEGFSRDNFLGHLQDAEGGGIPLTYFWNAQLGLALMHIDPFPRDWHMPAVRGHTGTSAAFELRRPVELRSGERLCSLPVVLSVHAGDFFAPLALYRELLAAQNVRSPDPIPADYEPAWCSWGYEFDVRPEQMTGVLPELGRLGIRWLTLDDRWFDSYGDWNPRRDTFPGGVEDIRRMNDVIHRSGAFCTIWWYPLCVEDGQGAWDSHTYGTARLFEEHPDWVILDVDGEVARNNRHLAMLCPALPAVQAHIAQLTHWFIGEWGFDGHKLDNIYTIPACHNPRHHHSRPEESTEAMAEVYRVIFETTRRLRPNSVIQICPCGTPITHHLLPFTDQAVTADPTSSMQIRQRIKFYKALAGPHAAIFADHVELSDGGIDFASEIGAGGVPGTKFVWPVDPQLQSALKEDWSLSPEKETLWQKWFDLYKVHRPASGEYLNLYDLAFDRPEGHAIRKGERLYYAFYAEKPTDHYAGQVVLRGLGPRRYGLLDYVNERSLGTAAGPQDVVLDVDFEGALLVVAIPE